MGGSRTPLEGIRILDLTQTLSGPYGSMLLADLGAEVIKVESPARPDRGRRVPPAGTGGVSSYYLSLNRNKRSVALDLKVDAQRDAFLRLVEVSDVLFDNFRPGVAERLGLTETVLLERNPALIRCSLSGFGQTGPDSNRPAYDYLVQALAGTMALTGEPDGAPTRYGISIVDHVGGLFAAMAIAVALVGRERHGVGETIDVSLFDSHLSMLTYLASAYLNCGEVPERQPYSSHPYLVPCQRFPTRDGNLVIMVFDDHFWPLLCAAVERPELADDPRFGSSDARLRHRDELTELLSKVLVQRPSDEWARVLHAAGVPAAPVQSVPEALAMEQTLARGMVMDLAHPTYGAYRAVGNPVKLTSLAEQPGAAAPLLGEDTVAVLRDLCGMTSAEVAAVTGAQPPGGDDHGA